jgi:hypothetical protein
MDHGPSGRIRQVGPGTTPWSYLQMMTLFLLETPVDNVSVNLIPMPCWRSILLRELTGRSDGTAGISVAQLAAHDIKVYE